VRMPPAHPLQLNSFEVMWMSPQIVPYWRPLRSVDAVPDFSHPSGFPATVYDKDVPDHFLAKVEKLEEDFGKGVLQFAVSDYAAARPDPFGLVRAGEVMRVIDVWDEPGWGL